MALVCIKKCGNQARGAYSNKRVKKAAEETKETRCSFRRVDGLRFAVCGLPETSTRKRTSAAFFCSNLLLCAYCDIIGM